MRSRTSSLLFCGICFIVVIATASDGARRHAEPIAGTGTLGLPFGTIAAIRGKWEERDLKGTDGVTKCFVVLSVNGHDVDREVVFDSHNVEVVSFSDIKTGLERASRRRDANDLWECSGWETASFIGFPEEAHELFIEHNSTRGSKGERLFFLQGDWKFRMQCSLKIFRLTAVERSE